MNRDDKNKEVEENDDSDAKKINSEKYKNPGVTEKRLKDDSNDYFRKK